MEQRYRKARLRVIRDTEYRNVRFTTMAPKVVLQGDAKRHGHITVAFDEMNEIRRPSWRWNKGSHVLRFVVNNYDRADAYGVTPGDDDDWFLEFGAESSPTEFR